MDLRGGDNCVALLDLGIYYTRKNTKESYRKNKFKISETAWDEDFELPDVSYSIQIFKITLNTSAKRMKH